MFINGRLFHSEYKCKYRHAQNFKCERITGMSTGIKTNPTVTERAIAAVLDAALERQGMTQTELGDAVGISQPQVSKILSGLKPMTMSEMLNMCKALGLVASEVLEQAEGEAP